MLLPSRPAFALYFVHSKKQVSAWIAFASSAASKLNGTIPISGAKNAALPLMIAGLLTEETLILDNVPRLADVAQLQRILGNHGVDIMSAGKRPGDQRISGPDPAHFGSRHHRHHRAL